MKFFSPLIILVRYLVAVIGTIYHTEYQREYVPLIEHVWLNFKQKKFFLDDHGLQYGFMKLPETGIQNSVNIYLILIFLLQI